jgi:hypothetical protein
LICRVFPLFLNFPRFFNFPHFLHFPRFLHLPRFFISCLFSIFAFLISRVTSFPAFFSFPAFSLRYRGGGDLCDPAGAAGLDDLCARHQEEGDQ